MKMKFDSSYSPLTPAVFYILFALRRGKQHGYGLMKQIEKDSNGVLKLTSGTLYTCLKSLVVNELIQEIEMSTEEATIINLPRKYYELTPKGNEFLFAEIRRFHHIIKGFYEDESDPS